MRPNCLALAWVTFMICGCVTTPNTDEPTERFETSHDCIAYIEDGCGTTISGQSGHTYTISPATPDNPRPINLNLPYVPGKLLEDNIDQTAQPAWTLIRHDY